MRPENIVPERESAAHPQLIYPSVLTRNIFAEGHNKNLSYSHANSSAGELTA